jgi:DNA (cytosine-5)-methyltransferase 1
LGGGVNLQQQMFRLLDLYCGAGGAAMGYHRVGFEVIGVDYVPQHNYPFRRHIMKALEFLQSPTFDRYNFHAIHASPPCQYHSRLSNLERNAIGHRDHIRELRSALEMTGLPYVIENVEGANLKDPALICGASIQGIYTIRHRLFETNFTLVGINCPKDQYGYIAHPRTRRTDVSSKYINSDFKNCRVSDIRIGFGIDWMTRRELQEAIPPAYTEYVGRQLKSHLLDRLILGTTFRKSPAPVGT